MKNKLKWFVYASLLFLGIFLFNSGYLIVPEIHSVPYLIGSIAFLLLGFVLHILTANVLVAAYDLKCSYREMFVAYGLSVLGKYIPGKVFLLMGRAYYLKEKKGFSAAKLSTIFLNGQVLEILVGILLGSVAFLYADVLKPYLIPAIILVLLLCLFVFSPLIHKWTEKLVRRFAKKEVELPSLNLKQIKKTLPVLVATWLCWGAAYAFFVSSLAEVTFSSYSFFSFILAVSLGVLAIISPGGMGVREAILVAFLIPLGIKEDLAITIAVCSRIWFLIGELTIFSAALILQKKS